MKTERLIDLLARGAGPAPRAVAARRLGPAALAGLAASGALALALIGPLPAAMLGSAGIGIKLLYGGALALAAAWLAVRMGQPAAAAALPRRAVAAVLGGMALVAVASLMATPVDERPAALLGQSWSSCPWAVVGLSLPALAATLWALSGLAPTRPRSAGFAAGLLAGALGTIGYALACREPSPAFVAIWYSAGIAITALLGALIGPRVLRW